MPEEKAIGVVITGTGDGGELRSRTTAITSGDQPNVDVHTVPWYLVLLSRNAQFFLTSLLSFVTLNGATGVLGAAHAYHNAAELALVATVGNLIKDLIIFLTKLNESFPRWTA